MNSLTELSFTLESSPHKRCRQTAATEPQGEIAAAAIPRIARLMALAIRLEGLIREATIRDYAEAARVGRVTRARMTQIMRLLQLAPDIQERILFLPLLAGLNERNLRPIADQIDWDEQRRLFRKFIGSSTPCDRPQPASAV